MTLDGSFRNALFSVAQVVVVAACYLAMYAFLFRFLGAAQLGIWSILVASLSLVRLGEAGTAPTASRFCAEALAQGKGERCVAVVLLSILVTLVGSGLLLAAVHPFTVAMLARLVGPAEVAGLDGVMTLIGVSVVLSSLAVTLSGVLDGLGCFGLRSGLNSLTALATSLATIVLTYRYELLGAALAQLIANAFFVAVLAGVIARKLWRIGGRLSCLELAFAWQFVRFAFGFQLINIVRLGTDPVVKYLLAVFGSLPLLGAYEMASKLALQLRSLTAAAAQVLLPAVARADRRKLSELRAAYGRADRMTQLMNSLVHNLSIAMLLPFLLLWTGSLDSGVVALSLMLLNGWLINTTAAAAFYFGIGSGDIRQSAIASWILLLWTVLMGVVLGAAFAGFGIVAAFASGLGISGLYVRSSYARELGGHHQRGPDLWPIILAVLLSVFDLLALEALWTGQEYNLGHLLGFSIGCSLLVLLVETMRAWRAFGAHRWPVWLLALSRGRLGELGNLG